MPKTYTTPGVYVQEVDGFAPSIVAAPTGVTLFLGEFTDGRDWPEDPLLLTGLADFVHHYGPLTEGDPLCQAVQRYYGEGGIYARLSRYHPATGFDADGLEQRIADKIWFDLIVTAPPAPMGDWEALLGFAHSRNAFVLLDGPLDGGVIDVPEMDQALLTCGAVYSPWLLRGTVSEPPSAAVAAVAARTDARVGVWKAPAGTSATIDAGVTVKLNDDEQGIMNQAGQNGIRVMPNFGTVIWGARTLGGAEGADGNYRYVPVKRMAQWLNRSFASAFAFAAFEPNGPDLWATIRMMTSAWLHQLWSEGAMLGSKPEQAFFVMCDASTTTPVEVAEGRVFMMVGFAPLHPAEFVVLSLTIQAGPAAA